METGDVNQEALVSAMVTLSLALVLGFKTIEAAGVCSGTQSLQVDVSIGHVPGWQYELYTSTATRLSRVNKVLIGVTQLLLETRLAIPRKEHTL